MLITAATRPLTLGVGGVGLAVSAGLVGAAAAIGSVVPAIAAIGVTAVAWGGLTVWDAVFDSKLRRRLAVATSAPKGRPELAVPEGLPGDLHNLFVALVAAAGRVRDAIDGADAVVSPHLLEVWGQCEVLLDEAAKVAERGKKLSAYLDSIAVEQLRQDRDALLARAQRVNDAEAAASWRQAADARSKQIETYQQIGGIYERIGAELAALMTSLDEMHARVVRLNAADLEDAIDASRSIGQRLTELRGEVGVLERAASATLREVAT